MRQVIAMLFVAIVTMLVFVFRNELAPQHDYLCPPLDTLVNGEPAECPRIN